MGRAPCCDKANVKKGPWSPEEDSKLKEYIEKHGTGGNWIALPQKAGLKRCGKSCRLRWLNYLRPNIKHGEFSDDEDRIICSLYANIGSRISLSFLLTQTAHTKMQAGQLPGRTDNDIKNYWNTKLKKKLLGMINPIPQRKPHRAALFSSFLQAKSSPSSASSFTCGNNSYYALYTEPISFSSSPLSNSTPFTTASMLQPTEIFVGPMKHYQVKDSLIMFGGEASCCSSDGSCNIRRSQVKEEYEYVGGVANNNSEQIQTGLQNNIYSGVEENQKLMVSRESDGDVVNEWSERPNGSWGENPLDYGLEEIKQLISTSSVCNNFLFDEHKTEEKVIYH